MILPIYKMYALVLTAIFAAAIFLLLSSVRKQQIAKLPPAPTVKVRADELAKKIDACRDVLLGLKPDLKNEEVAGLTGSIAKTLELIADEVEKDPKDRNKVRKLANHYSAMITNLVEKYIQLEAQTSGGDNIRGAMTQIQEGLERTDQALKQLLDDLFSDDAMEVSADITVLEELLKTDGTENKMDFSELDM
jgi:hypothetical protein